MQFTKWLKHQRCACVCVRIVCMRCVMSPILYTSIHKRSQFCFGLTFYINCLESNEICGLKCATTKQNNNNDTHTVEMLLFLLLLRYYSFFRYFSQNESVFIHF